MTRYGDLDRSGWELAASAGLSNYNRSALHRIVLAVQRAHPELDENAAREKLSSAFEQVGDESTARYAIAVAGLDPSLVAKCLLGVMHEQSQAEYARERDLYANLRK